MAYPELTTLRQLIDQYDGGAGPPQGTAPISELDDAIRQLQGFLVNFLRVAFDPDTNLIQAAGMSGSPYAVNSIPGDAIQGELDGVQVKSDSIGYGQLEKVASDGSGGAVREDTIGKYAVSEDKIKDGAVTGAKLADGAIDRTSVFGGAYVNAAAVAEGAISDIHIAGVNGSKVEAGTLPPTALSTGALTTGEKGIPYIIEGGTNVVAKIGGSVTAAYNAGSRTLEFSLGAIGAPAALFTISTSGTATQGAWTARTGLAYAAGSTDVATVDADQIVFGAAGTYLVLFDLAGYSVESLVAGVRLNTTVYPGNAVHLPLGVGGVSSGYAYLTIADPDTEKLDLVYYCSRTFATYGLGLDNTAQGRFASVAVIRLA